MSKTSVKIKLESYEHSILDKVVSNIIKAVLRSGNKVVGPIPLPTKKERFTVLRSPHIDKKSREHFQRHTHKRIIEIVNYNPQTMNLLKSVELDPAVDIKIKL
ncbi:30S ribosomal protein S10 [Rickettsiales bacterium LUAb2]